MVVHGIPGPFKLSQAATSCRSTSASSTTAGSPTPRARSRSARSRRSPSKLLEVTEGSLFEAVEQCRPGNRLGDVSHAVQEHVEADGFSVVRSLVGHGIGRSMHEEPADPQLRPARQGLPLEEGMVLAVEPMVTAGRHMVRMGDDGWAIYSQDGSLAAHFEFTSPSRRTGPRILTPWHESQGRRRRPLA